jgi:hypothetical protein
MRGPGDFLRRSLDNALANWPLLLINIAAQVASVAVIFIGILVAVLPLIMFGVLAAAAPKGDPEVWLTKLFENNPLIILYLVAVVSLLIIPIMIVYSFVEAGRLGVYLDGERNADLLGSSARPAFKVFDPTAWAAHAKANWWRIFLLYNIVWGIYGLILLIPLALIVGAMVVLHETPSVVGVGCLLGAAFLLLAVFFAFVFGIWSKVSNTLCVQGQRGVGESMRLGWAFMREQFGGLLVLTIILIAISLALGGSLFGVYFMIGIASSIPGVAVLLVPLQVALSLGQSLLSAVITGWFTAAYVSFVHSNTR